jgi:hypothetical protein
MRGIVFQGENYSLQVTLKYTLALLPKIIHCKWLLEFPQWYYYSLDWAIALHFCIFPVDGLYSLRPLKIFDCQ